MKKKMRYIIPAILIGLLVSGGAIAANILLSNVVQETNTVSDTAMTLSRYHNTDTTGKGGINYPDLPTTPVKGMTYDLQFNGTETNVAGITVIKLALTVGKTGISPGDVTLKSWNGTTWNAISMTDQGDTLYAEIVMDSTPTTNEVALMPLLAVYNLNGSYTLSAQAIATQ